MMDHALLERIRETCSHINGTKYCKLCGVVSKEECRLYCAWWEEDPEVKLRNQLLNYDVN